MSFRCVNQSIYQQACTRVTPLLREPDGSLREKWTELEWQALWYSGAFGTSFRAVSGSLVEIVQFGFWNREPGPDFVHASLRVDGEQLLEGDIELDMHVADWDRHGHSQNPAFDRVVLHLFLHKTGASHFTRTTQNREVIQVHLQAESDLLHIHPPIAHPGRCCAPLRQLPGRTIDSLIETAARVRMRRKADQLRRVAIVHGLDEALFQAFAVAFGYKLNKIPFLVLAQRAKLQILREQGSAAESLLFGISGFLEDRKIHRAVVMERDYWRYLWEHWWQIRSQYAHLVLRQNLWRFGMTRPSNHPHRRLGALAELVRRWKEVRLLSPRLEEVAEWISGLSHPFWDHHFTLTSQRTVRPFHLLGQTRINEILANVVHPMLVAMNQDDWESYKGIRSELSNRRLTIVCQRLFGETNRAREHIRFLYQQQGLLQIFEDFCMADFTNCDGCRFPEMVAKLSD
ncbi:MAG: DUF2851 family protein [Verrucomicrobia bacterium]|nr:DUF2851 family protein [Verrucomicrobiota bacterium]MBV9300070.1 DUF2851 family protein [Verrucomicrobiota bacterium]